MHDLDRTLRTYESETEASNLYQEIYGGSSFAGESSDAELDALATELLAVSDEAELDQFLGRLVKRAGSFARKLAPILKPIAKKLLPLAGRAVGTYFGGPAGAALGSKLGSLATRLFEVDFESMESQEVDMEVARSFVRLATAAADQAAKAPSSADPNKVVRNAMTAAARTHAPGLLRSGGGAATAAQAQSGRWVRNKRGGIVVLGV